MKDKTTKMWIPLYVDKWIFGSTRIELEPAERGVFVDLMAFGAKDEGYIRANETTAYPHTQLAGLLNIPVELLQSTITKCLHFDKLVEPIPGIYMLKNWDEFQFSRQYVYELESGRAKKMDGSLQNCQQGLQKPLLIGKDRIGKNRREHTTVQGFDAFWTAYPKKVGKDKALEAWNKRKPSLELCLKALNWQTKCEQWTKEGGQYIPLPATWINQGRWQDEPLNANKTSIVPGGGIRDFHKNDKGEIIIHEREY